MSLFSERVEQRMESANTLVCVGLDPALDKLPAHYDQTVESVVHFCQAIIEATLPYAAAYKPNLAFFVALGRPGMNALWAVRHSIPADVPVILDCKVGDVDQTAMAYAHGWYTEFGFDAITVNPYLGEDAVAPFLRYEDKGAIILCKTSNPGSGDLQDVRVEGGDSLFLTVADRCRQWDATYPASVGLVVGATYPEQLGEVRRRVDDQVILLPGVGAQGGDIEASLHAGLNGRGMGLLCSASRGIIYADGGKAFDAAAEQAAQSLRNQINDVRSAINV
jgi:orotidine-5'-phosphate decarboxylase